MTTSEVSVKVNGPLVAGFMRSVKRFPDRPALQSEELDVSYAALYALASEAARLIDHTSASRSLTAVGILGDRSLATYSGILGAVLSGHCYVPLSTLFPPTQLAYMIEKAGCGMVLCDEFAYSRLHEIIGHLTKPTIFALPPDVDAAGLVSAWPLHVFCYREPTRSPIRISPRSVDPDAVAYIMFTSGSTGTPKGVPVTQRNIASLMEHSLSRYELSESDRFSQMFPVTFDLSVFDLFVAWHVGAAVCYPSKQQMMSLGIYLKDAGITVFYGNPSMLMSLKKIGAMEPGSYPNLRLCLFCGEALPAGLMSDWSRAASNAVCENLYGPTELTLTCTYYRWEAGRSESEVHIGVVPIGYAHDCMEWAVVDESLEVLRPGVPGELVMSGPQRSPGYLSDPEKTEAAFVRLPGREGVYYRTGDKVVQAAADGPLLYLGRIDNQLQVHGARVEPGEVEHAIRKVTGQDVVVVVGWPTTDRGADALVAFLQEAPSDIKKVQRSLRQHLPAFMIPRKFHVLPEFPLNSNGKIDRGAVVALLDQGVFSNRGNPGDEHG